MKTCPHCLGPLGGRWGTRCYRCHPGRTRTGEDRACGTCGRTFYAPAWVMRDTARRSGTYCSVACKTTAMTGRELRSGGSYVRKDGYRAIKTGAGQYQLEHRVVVAAAIGRPLRTDEEVHHVNGDKLDNRLENLEVLSPSAHQDRHAGLARRRRTRLVFTCEACGTQYERKASRAGATRFCSGSCRSRSVSQARWAAARANSA